MGIVIVYRQIHVSQGLAVSESSSSLWTLQEEMAMVLSAFVFVGALIPMRHGCNYNPQQSEKICFLWFHISWIIYSLFIVI